MNLTAPTLYEGRAAQITWTSGAPGASVTLERKLGAGFNDPVRPTAWDERDALALAWDKLDGDRLSWEQWESGGTITLLYEGTALSYRDAIPTGVDVAQYRLSSGGERVLSALIRIERDTPPAVSGSDGYIGRKYEPFSVAFTVTDAFPQASLRVTAALDGKTLFDREGLPSPYQGEAAVDAQAFGALTAGRQYVLSVRARDDLGLEAVRLWTFTAIEDLRPSSVYYLLRDGVPIARSARIAPFFDYGAVGEHRYRVRAVDRMGGFCDSGEVVMATEIECTTLAPADDPQDMTRLRYRMDDPPAHESLFETGLRPLLFEGRGGAASEWADGQTQSRWDISFSAETRAEYDRVLLLARARRPVVYRDPFGNCAVVCIEALPVRFRDLAADFTVRMAQIGAEEGVPYD